MGAFDEVHILTAGERPDLGALVHAEVGCKTGDIVRKAMAAGLTVPLGARPSVGAGFWLQGGIGHLARQYGLASDAVVGAVIVSVNSGQVLSVGYVSSQHRPPGAGCLDDVELLWGLKGAGANFGIVISVTFKAYPVPTYSVRNWVLPLNDDLEARHKLDTFDTGRQRTTPESFCRCISVFEQRSVISWCEHVRNVHCNAWSRNTYPCPGIYIFRAAIKFRDRR